MTDVRLHPLFLPGSAGPLFALLVEPRRFGAGDLGVVYLPPFAEEMNRSRRMVNFQARAFAHRGVGVLLLDPFGTGDSGSDFADARWEIWCRDVQHAVKFLVENGYRRVALWGLRLGAMLAASVAAAGSRSPKPRIADLILWQPILSGETMLTQFLRLRVAADMSRTTALSTTVLRDQLRSGEFVEVAGYDLAPALASSIDGLRLDALVPQPGTRVMWIDIATSGTRSVPPAGRRVIEAWRNAGVAVSASVVSGDPFWATPEITLAPELLAATSWCCEQQAGVS